MAEALWNAVVRHAKAGTERHSWSERAWALGGLLVAGLAMLSQWSSGLGRSIVLAALALAVMATVGQVLVRYRYRVPPSNT